MDASGNSSLTKFDNVVNGKLRLSHFFKHLLFGITLLQLISVGLQYNNHAFYNKGKSMSGIIVAILYPSLLIFQETSIATPWFYFLMVIFALDLLIYMVFRFSARHNVVAASFFMRFYQYFSSTLHVCLYSPLAASFGKYCSKYNSEVSASYLIVLFFTILFIAITIRNVAYFINVAHQFLFSEQIYAVFKQHPLIASHFLVAINIFVTGYNGNELISIRLDRYMTLGISLILVYNDLRGTNWLSFSKAVLTRCVHILNVFISVFMSITLDYDVPFLALNIFLYVAIIVSAIISYLYTQKSYEAALKRLDVEVYQVDCSEHRALGDLVWGLVFSHPAVITGKHIRTIAMAFSKSTEIQIFAVRVSLFLSNVDVYKIENYEASKYYPIWAKYFQSIRTILSRNSIEMQDYNKENNRILKHSFSKLMQSTVTIYQILLDENTFMLKNILKEFSVFEEELNKTIGFYLQDPNSREDKRFFYKLYSTLFRNNLMLPEMKRMVEYEVKFNIDAIGSFESHIASSTYYPECYKSFTPIMSPIIPAGIIQRTGEIIHGHPDMENVTGLGKLKFGNWFIILLCIILTCTPIISSTLIFVNADKFNNDVNRLTSCQIFIQDTCYELFKGTEFELLNNSISRSEKEYLLNQGMKRLHELENHGNLLVYGFSNNEMEFESKFLEEQMNEIDFYPYVERNMTLRYALMNVPLLFTDIYLKRVDYGFNETLRNQHFFQIIEKIIHSTEGIHLRYNINFHIFYASIFINIFGCVFCGFVLHGECKRVSLFILALGETNKSELVRGSAFLRSLDENIGKVDVVHDKKANKHYFLITIIFYGIAMVILQTFFVLVARCFQYIVRYQYESYMKNTTRYYDVSVFLNSLLMTNQTNGYDCFTSYLELKQMFGCRTCSLINYIFEITDNGLSAESILNTWVINRSVVYDEPLVLLDEYFNIAEPALTNMTDSIILNFDSVIQGTRSDMTLVCILIAILMVWFYIVTGVQLMKIREPIGALLKAMSMLPAGTVTNDAKIILKESFVQILKRQPYFNYGYYDAVFDQTQELVIVISNGFTILALNQSAKNYIHHKLGTNNEEVIGHQIDVLSDHYRLGTTDEWLADYVHTFIFDNAYLPESVAVTYVAEGRKEYYQCSLVPLYAEKMSVGTQSGNPSYYAIMLRDISDEVHQQQMVEDETAKLLQIVQSILPKEIATVILEEGSGISFSVETAAISYCDIVSFTPWCSSCSATEVVTTLNLMFRLFDERRSKRPSVTKIKCIGDCYMAASGIFGSVENAWIDMVEFCLDLVDAIGMVNKKLGTNLQVRVGAAMGGPISCGVLGIEKPHFDIWGSLITEGQNMESSGKPMMVHINELLYENVKDIIKCEVFICDDKTYLMKRSTA